MPVKGQNYEIIAQFKCPIDDHPVKAHGFVWKCTRKGCYFRMARRWKKDPTGWFGPNRLYYQEEAEEYRRKQEGKQ